MSRTHLDHASTSHPKPREVLAAMQDWYENVGVGADRGDSSAARAVAATIDDARARLARLCGTAPDRVAFTSGATESIHLFLAAFLRPGARVVTTATEHSSVARPLAALRDAGRAELRVVECDARGFVEPGAVAGAITSARTDLLVVNHASNVTGAIQDVAPMIESARAHGCTTLLDASQTAGVVDIGVGADAVVASAHKGLLGPPGLGFLAIRPSLELLPVKHGGTGSAHALERHPTRWPTAFEAGTPNTPAILGLHAALCWRDGHDHAEALRRALASLDELRARLTDARTPVRVVGPGPGTARIAILSFVPSHLDPAEAGVLLDAAGITVRTGFHCAPWIHGCLDTAAAGTVRVSPGPFVSADRVRAVATALGL